MALTPATGRAQLQRVVERPGGELLLTLAIGASVVGIIESVSAYVALVEVVVGHRRRRREQLPADRLADLPGAPAWAGADPFDLLRDMTLREEVTDDGETPPVVP